jgi:hypothetical protein
VRDPVGDDARLTAACPGENQEWAVGSFYGFALLGIQVVEKPQG